MSDFISREQAIKDCAEAFQLGEAYCDKQSIIGILNAEPTIDAEPKWIPCSERLPEEGRKVLVTDIFGVYVGEFIDAEENWGGEHFVNEHGMQSKSVIAWMPLPEPYKEVEKDG